MLAKASSTTKKPLDVDRALDEIVGRYRPHANERFLARYGKWLARAAIFACLALTAVMAIMGTLDRNIRDAKTQADEAKAAYTAKKPVIVDLLPPK